MDLFQRTYLQTQLDKFFSDFRDQATDGLKSVKVTSGFFRPRTDTILLVRQYVIQFYVQAVFLLMAFGFKYRKFNKVWAIVYAVYAITVMLAFGITLSCGWQVDETTITGYMMMFLIVLPQPNLVADAFLLCDKPCR